MSFEQNVNNAKARWNWRGIALGSTGLLGGAQGLGGAKVTFVDSTEAKPPMRPCAKKIEIIASLIQAWEKRTH